MQPIKFTIALALAGGGLLCAQAAQAASGFYVQGALGGAERQALSGAFDSPTDTFGLTPRVNGVAVPYPNYSRVHYDVGVNLDASAGYRFDLGRLGMIRTELEFEYTHYRYAGANTGSNGSSADPITYVQVNTPIKGDYISNYSGLANIFYVYRGFAAVHPYVGGGVGYQYRAFEGAVEQATAASTIPRNPYFPGYTANARTIFNYPPSHGHDGTYMAEAGLEFPITRNLSLTPAYRYEDIFSGDHPISIVKMGLRYDF